MEMRNGVTLQIRNLAKEDPGEISAAFEEIGWNKPVAIRFHTRRRRERSMPLTIHTSPLEVQTAARRPSAKKSNPVSRIHE